ncbi:MAG: type II CRISPR-associated endonuclease Cas1 [Cyclobacteriaceae bacterium]
MIKRTLYFGNGAHLSTSKQQLIVTYTDSAEKKSVPIEDIGVIILDHYNLTFSHTLIQRLLSNNVAFITCDSHHLPQGMMLNLNASYHQQEHFRVQMEASQTLKDRLWQQTIQAKINNQAKVLSQNGVEVVNLERWAKKVQPGDLDNYEARAAAYYWGRLFQDETSVFKRGRHEGEPNNLLNYGYSILRGVTARSLVASGLLPTLGYHHSNKYNAYCLADDVMEPYRPFVDEVVLEIVRSREDYSELTTGIKQELLRIPQVDVHINGKLSPLMIAMQQTTASLYKCYSKELKKLKLPQL